MLRGLIWAGVLLAPVAALVVLLGQSSNTVRFAVLLIAVAIALIGASVLIRSDPVLGRSDVEERVAEEVSALRRELRAEFGGGRGAAPVHGGPPPPMPMPAPAATAQMRQQHLPEEEPSGFFADLPAEGQYPDPFTNNYPENAYPANGYPPNDYAEDEYAADYEQDDFAQPSMPAGPPPTGTPRPPAGGRAGVPVASAAVRPPARTGPGLTTGGRPINPEPTGRAVASAAASVPPPPQVPRQRGAAPVPPPPAPPRAAASVRPGTPYGHQPDSLADDFGASQGYAAQAPAPQPSGVYGSPASGNTYGAPGGTYGGNGNDFDSDEYNGYGAPSYGADYGPAPSTEYGAPQHEPGTTTGDPNYRARRHRPSANDTNVGSLSDFASYGGYTPDPDHGRR
ncbi:hypothetical protein Aab01nite_59950 [Paractinoplanes abujensis]|nr:hypothetical protein Aab01nite_59950 [Actinoplanes abujensis]